MSVYIDGLTSGYSQDCYTDDMNAAVSTTSTTVGYFCAVYNATATSTTGLAWSGAVKVSGPSGWLTSTSASSKVCRYHDYDNSGTDTNSEHPASYSSVSESLTDQNFLVIKGSKNCETATVNVGSQTGVVVYYNTSAIQP